MFAAVWVLATSSKDDLNQLRDDETQTSQPFDRTVNPSATPRNPPVTSPTTQRAPKTNHVLLSVLQRHPPTRLLLAILGAVCIGAPIFEELFFRGFLFRAIASRFGSPVGMAMSGLLFGLAHVGAVPLKMTVPLGVMGVALAWLFHQTASLLPGMAVHAFVNALSAGLVMGLGAATLGLILTSWVVIAIAVVPWLESSPRPIPSPATI